MAKYRSKGDLGARTEIERDNTEHVLDQQSRVRVSRERWKQVAIRHGEHGQTRTVPATGIWIIICMVPFISSTLRGHGKVLVYRLRHCTCPVFTIEPSACIGRNGMNLTRHYTGPTCGCADAIGATRRRSRRAGYSCRAGGRDSDGHQ